MNEAKVKKYFERIGLEMPETIIPDHELLKKLAFHNLISIPYENLQFLTKQIIPCDPDSLFQRIVVEKKGGICHDIAGLFGWFLSELGYTVIQIGTKSLSPKLGPHVHKSLIVTDCTGTEWLTEIGYTPFMNNKAPIRFITDIDQTFGNETFRIEERDGKKCLIGPTDTASYQIEYWDIGPEIGSKSLQLKGMTLWESPKEVLISERQRVDECCSAIYTKNISENPSTHMNVLPRCYHGHMRNLDWSIKNPMSSINR